MYSKKGIENSQMQPAHMTQASRAFFLCGTGCCQRRLAHQTSVGELVQERNVGLGGKAASSLAAG